MANADLKPGQIAQVRSRRYLVENIVQPPVAPIEKFVVEQEGFARDSTDRIIFGVRNHDRKKQID